METTDSTLPSEEQAKAQMWIHLGNLFQQLTRLVILGLVILDEQHHSRPRQR